MALPPDYALRQSLNDEVHARPPAPLLAPARVAFLALLTEASEAPREHQSLLALAAHFGHQAPTPEARHFLFAFPGFRLRWERHTEFSTFTVFRPATSGATPEGGFDALPADWLGTLPGKTLVAAEVTLEQSAAAADAAWPLPEAAENLIGAAVADGAAAVFTDFRIDAAGLTRFTIIDRRMSANQAGRLVQRLLEIETYRMMALLAFPLARQVHADLSAAESELARITETLTEAGTAEEPKLLDDLTRLAAQMERAVAQSRFRFGAAQAYHTLVERRVAELREARLPGRQTIGEFMGRRLAPAMHTCAAAQRRQEELSAHIARASQLLRTRVEVAHEAQNQAILASMDRRAKLQLRLQETVEGLSVAAISYYTVGLIAYLLKALKAAGVHLDAELATGASIPVVALLVALGVRRIRKSVAALHVSD